MADVSIGGARGSKAKRSKSNNPSRSLEVWRSEHVPLLYDALYSYPCVGGCNSVQWSGLEAALPPGHETSFRVLFCSEREDMDKPGSLRIAAAEFPTPHQIKSNRYKMYEKAQTRKEWRRIKAIYSGDDVNRIRALSDEVLVTLGEKPLLNVWNWKSEHRQREASQGSRNKPKDLPECTLDPGTHVEFSEFAIEVRQLGTNGGIVAVGGNDTSQKEGEEEALISIWKMHPETLSNLRVTPSKTLRSVGIGKISDLSISPRESGDELVSVSEGGQLALWDLRLDQNPIALKRNAHDGDANCVDWNGNDAMLLATGGSDGVVKIWDRRRIATPLHFFGSVHTKDVYGIQWQKRFGRDADPKSVLASCSQDGSVVIWDTRRASLSTVDTVSYSSGGIPRPEIVLRHEGHAGKTVIELDWSPFEDDPWSIVSVSFEHDSDSSSPPEALFQFWRPSELVTKDGEDRARYIDQRRKANKV